MHRMGKDKKIYRKRLIVLKYIFLQISSLKTYLGPNNLIRYSATPSNLWEKCEGKEIGMYKTHLWMN